MNRRQLLRGSVVGIIGLTGCLSDGMQNEAENTDNGDNENTGEYVNAARIEECELTYINEYIMDISTARGRSQIARVENPWISVSMLERQNEGVVYEVRSGWGVDYHDERLVSVRVADNPDEPLSDAPQSDDPEFEDADEFRGAITVVVEGDRIIRLSEFEPGYDDAVEALQSAFEQDLDDGPFFILHDDVVVEIEHVQEPGVHADYGTKAYYHVIDGEVYRTESRDESPTDGKRIEC